MSAAITRAKVIAAKLITPTVRWFQFEALGSPSNFHAGQWLDLYIPGSDVIGGYSMCSSPLQFDNSRKFDLAVKVSDHPAARWMHDQCKVGMELKYMFGGDVYLDRSNTAMGRRHYLLIAGGVGINPIYSILQTVISQTNCPVSLLYTTQSQEELMFSGEISELAEGTSRLVVRYFLSKETSSTDEDSKCLVTAGRRINEEDLKLALQNLAIDNLDVFLCGPDEMITSMNDILQCLGVADTSIHYERWS